MSKKGMPAQVKPLAMKPIGILGGGQLARMMVLRAQEMGLQVAVLSENANDPAALVATLWQKGALDHPQSLTKFVRSCSVVTFESEFLNAELLADIERGAGVSILPRPDDMFILQDRLSQKTL